MNEEYLKVIEELKNSVNILLKEFLDLKKELKKFDNKKVDLSKQFSIINLPSKGRYYKNKKKSLLIRYLTAIEEYVLCDSMLMESGKGLELVLSSLIIDDIDVKELLLSDFQAILIFLRSTAFGDSIDITPTCPHCSIKIENEFNLSGLEFKKPEYEPNQEGKYIVSFPGSEMEFVISPITLAKELEKIENESDSDYFIYRNEEGNATKIRKERSLSLVYNIDSINGITDKEKIKNIIRKQPKKNVDAIIDFIKKNEVGVDEKIMLKCESCGEEFIQNVSVGYNFISLPESYKNNIYEELFLLSYYGKNITIADAEKIPTNQRKWLINRIKKEIDKQNEAEKRAMTKSKSGKGKF